jgi:hypothetical protein
MRPCDQSKRIHIAAQIGPLSGTQAPVDCDKQTDRRTEEPEISLDLFKSGDVVAPACSESSVQLRAEALMPGYIRLTQVFRKIRILTGERSPIGPRNLFYRLGR